MKSTAPVLSKSLKYIKILSFQQCFEVLFKEIAAVIYQVYFIGQVVLIANKTNCQNIGVYMSL